MKDPIYKPSGKAAEYAHLALNLYKADLAKHLEGVNFTNTDTRTVI